METTGARTLAGSGLMVGKLRPYRLLPPLLGLVLTACAHNDTRHGRFALASGVPPQQAIALPPPGGPSVVGVVERRYANAIQQDIALATNSSVPGQNLFRVQMFGPVGAKAGEIPLIDRPPHEADLRREMRTQLPGVVMQRSPLYTQNGYGPFGYAVGRRGANDLCLYAWQRITGAGNGAPFAGGGTIQVRLRICQTGASEQGLLAFMYGYTINASFEKSNWNPYGTPAGADPRLGALGQPIVPSATSGYDAMLDPPPAAAPAPARSARRPAPPPPTPPPGAPVVPAPPPAEALPAPVIPPPPPE